MIDPRRQEFAPRNWNHSSFTDPIRKSNDDPDRSDEVEFITWAEGIKGSRFSYFRKSDEHKSGAWARRAPQNDGEEEFRWVAKEEDDSDVPSPKLWEQAAGSPTTQAAKTSPAHNHQPTSRAQVMARYRQEMLDLVKDMPESAYELSLKDLVELPLTGRPEQETPVKGTEKGKKQKAATKSMTRRMSRSESMDAGVFLLKMFLPFSFGGKRRKSSGGPSSKVSPKPVMGGPEKSTDVEWWNKNEYRDRSSSSGSSSSSNSIISSGRRKLTSCYSFFLTHRSKAGI